MKDYSSNFNILLDLEELKDLINKVDKKIYVCLNRLYYNDEIEGLKELVKEIKRYAEDAKVAIRNARRDGIDKAKAMQKDGEITEDELKAAETEIQKITDKNVEEVDKIIAAKETEIMSI